MKCPKCGHENREGAEFCGECGQALQAELVCPQCGHALAEAEPQAAKPPSPEPTSFAAGRYQVKKLLGEGGKKKVYLAHGNTLDRDVAFALIKTEKLDEEARIRIKREA